MRITIPDDVADAYIAYAEATGLSVDALVSVQLGRFRHLPPSQRAVVLGPAELDALEAQLGGGQIQTGLDLMKKIARLAAITFHNVRLDFTPNQLEELKYRADRQGKPVAELAKDIIRQLTEQFFWATPGGAGVGAQAPQKAKV